MRTLKVTEFNTQYPENKFDADNGFVVFDFKLKIATWAVTLTQATADFKRFKAKVKAKEAKAKLKTIAKNKKIKEKAKADAKAIKAINAQLAKDQAKKDREDAKAAKALLPKVLTPAQEAKKKTKDAKQYEKQAKQAIAKKIADRKIALNSIAKIYVKPADERIDVIYNVGGERRERNISVELLNALLDRKQKQKFASGKSHTFVINKYDFSSIIVGGAKRPGIPS